MDKARDYARLLLEAGVNLQPGQNLAISAEPIHWPFLVLVAEQAYTLGARYVEVDAIHPRLGRARVDFAGEADLAYVPSYRERYYQEVVDGNWARLALAGSELPDLYGDVNQSRFARLQTASRQAAKPLTEACGAGRVPWCVAALPTPRWAAKVLETEPSEDAANQLWDIMKPVLRLDRPDPARAWRDIAEGCVRRSETLTEYVFESLQFDGPGTELTVRCIPRGIWSGGYIQSARGYPFIPNLPTEEVFTAPDFRHTEGRATVTRPVEVLGKPVVGAWFEFRRGRVESFGAEEGEEQLATYFGMDEQARFLGEIALVDSQSPIYRSGRIFHNILYDENASCHFALGSGYPMAVPGNETMRPDELRAAGVNQSLLHTDFMIGSEAIQVSGRTPGGEEVPILRDGLFVGPFVATT